VGVDRRPKFIEGGARTTVGTPGMILWALALEALIAAKAEEGQSIKKRGNGSPASPHGNFNRRKILGGVLITGHNKLKSNNNRKSYFGGPLVYGDRITEKAGKDAEN